ncbi:MAG: DUF2851 family protein [Puniceicoccales bacterium]|jgi:hypothetical protein|nr:DUF2851 family protein [Puniceicoccales bacterium]
MQKPLLLAEISGLFGPVSVPERILQKIWWSGDFTQSGMRALGGKPLRCVRPGRWNHEEGPDFIGAVLEIAGETVTGDVEVHFYAEDWLAHGHGSDPMFDNVVLHVLLFPPRRATPLPTLSGRVPETFVMLPHLREDLEDYANREALLALESREKSAWHEALASLAEDARLPLLCAKARDRWGQKVRFARQRLNTHGWEEACHQLALETLGLRRNRAPMSALALAHPSARMRGARADALFDERREEWKLAGLRPANHPLRRLRQYLDLLGARPDWPARLAAWGANLPGRNGALLPPETVRFRRALRLPDVARNLSTAVFADTIGGTRMHTLTVDALLPLLAARAIERGGETGIEPETCERHWFHWWLGDVPDRLAADLRPELPAEGRFPLIIANGLFQGLLQLGHELG